MCVTCLVIGDGGEDEQEAAAEAAEKFLSEDLPENVFGAVWSSCLRRLLFMWFAARASDSHVPEGRDLAK